ncbi:Ulp1 protease family, C-terminal catalytic domain-containing protein [Cardiosporidium cionae]|uniref:Ulp1 protease family, C-terminal catalytic domain-containing protein n=1 Tax=Cardiosporidium cionae TaxID=476202 RepID=A0ABQ7JB87_9APIC|nr:Ulp1 protease family, C-terminal catalytic domain-containing protein [Cardiosporidium cionae]|eukprot:KAF8821223.1 Ulp1 protease family, C-terminal catalytic domain-containing protein [Cardiosporidium cionae]
MRRDGPASLTFPQLDKKRLSNGRLVAVVEATRFPFVEPLRNHAAIRRDSSPSFSSSEDGENPPPLASSKDPLLDTTEVRVRSPRSCLAAIAEKSVIPGTALFSPFIASRRGNVVAAALSTPVSVSSGISSCQSLYSVDTPYRNSAESPATNETFLQPPTECDACCDPFFSSPNRCKRKSSDTPILIQQARGDLASLHDLKTEKLSQTFFYHNPPKPPHDKSPKEPIHDTPQRRDSQESVEIEEYTPLPQYSSPSFSVDDTISSVIPFFRDSVFLHPQRMLSKDNLQKTDFIADKRSAVSSNDKNDKNYVDAEELLNLFPYYSKKNDPFEFTALSLGILNEDNLFLFPDSIWSTAQLYGEVQVRLIPSSHTIQFEVYPCSGISAENDVLLLETYTGFEWLNRAINWDDIHEAIFYSINRPRSMSADKLSEYLKCELLCLSVAQSHGNTYGSTRSEPTQKRAQLWLLVCLSKPAGVRLFHLIRKIKAISIETRAFDTAALLLNRLLCGKENEIAFPRNSIANSLFSRLDKLLEITRKRSALVQEQFEWDSTEDSSSIPIRGWDLNSICLYTSHLSRLEQDAFIDDSLIDFFAQFMLDYVFESWKQNGIVQVMNCFFIQKLLQFENAAEAYEHMKGWTKRLSAPLPKAKFIFLPINHCDLHWSLVILCHPYRAIVNKSSIKRDFRRSDPASFYKSTFSHVTEKPMILHLDSMKNCNLPKNLKRLLVEFLFHEYKAKCEESQHNEFQFECDDNFWIFKNCAKCPTQENSFDCGIFILEFIRFVLLHPERFDGSYSFKDLKVHSDVHDYSKKSSSDLWFTQQQVTHRRSAMARMLRYMRIRYNWRNCSHCIKNLKKLLGVP